MMGDDDGDGDGDDGLGTQNIRHLPIHLHPCMDIVKGIFSG